MTERTLEAVTVTFVDVVEKLTFMFGEHVSMDDVAPGHEPWTEARMAFTGDVTGSIAVIVPRSLQPDIAANILGLDHDALQQQAVLDDALREMLNVLCGHIIRAIAGPSSQFDLVTPQNIELAPDELRELMDDPDSTAYLLDDEPVLMNLKFERS
jgi:hypothetical protein